MALLPQELFDAITDEIHDKETLMACALVASSFRPPSQRKLCRKVRLGGLRCSRTALAEFPHLVSYIRDLTIYMWSTVSEYLAVAVVLRSVQSIESLAVLGGSRSPRKGSGLGVKASSALLDCLVSRPSLSQLKLSNVLGVPAALILAATAIPVVEFKSVRMARLGEDISEQHTSAPVPRLRHLILGDATCDALRVCNLLLHPRKPAYTQQIKCLEIHIDQHSANFDERIMAACAGTLKYLVLHNKDLIRLPFLPFVLEVEIKISVGDDRRLPASFSSNISQIASSLLLVETIALVFVVVPHHPGLEVDWPDDGPLPIFGPSFMDRTQLLYLRQVHCILRRQSTIGDISTVFDRFVPAMESTMPGLRGTGILRFTLDNPQ